MKLVLVRVTLFAIIGLVGVTNAKADVVKLSDAEFAQIENRSTILLDDLESYQPGSRINPFNMLYFDFTAENWNPSITELAVYGPTPNTHCDGS